MVINVFDFYRKIEDKSDKNPFSPVLQNPTYYILSEVNGKVRELTLKLKGEVECPIITSLKDFEVEGYKNYTIITNFLLGEEGERVRRSWGLTREDFKELIFELYFALVKEHTTCGIIKKGLLVFLGMWKFFIGRKLK